MGSKGGNSTTSTNTPPPQVMAQYQNVVNQANNVASTPYQSYGGQLVAGLNGQENTAINNVNNYANSAQPAYQGAMGLTLAGAGPAYAQQFSGQGVGQYMSPYQSQVINATEGELQNQDVQQAQQLNSNTIGAGAFGGDRAGVAQAALAGQQDLANNSTIANLNNQNYTQALGEFNNQQTTNLGAEQANLARLSSAGNQFGALGSAAQTAGLQGSAAQLQAGALQQQTQQAQDTAAYNQFLQQQAYPFQTTQWLANISEGIGSNSGGTSTTTQSAPSSAAGIVGAGLGLFSMLSRGGRVGRDMGGGVGGLIPYASNEPNVQSWVPNSGSLGIGHSMPQGAAPANNSQSDAANQKLLQDGMKGAAGAFQNSSMGDKFQDFMQDLPDNLAGGFGANAGAIANDASVASGALEGLGGLYARGGGVRQGLLLGGTPYGGASASDPYQPVFNNITLSSTSPTGLVQSGNPAASTGASTVSAAPASTPDPHHDHMGGFSPATSAGSEAAAKTTDGVSGANAARGGVIPRHGYATDGAVDPDSPSTADILAANPTLVAAAPQPAPTYVKYAPGLVVPAPVRAPPDNSYAEPASPNANTVGLAPGFADKIQDLQQDVEDNGIPNTLISGYRDNALQTKLYANYQAKQAGQPLPYPEIGNGGIAAPPGLSMHESGNASDVIANNPAQQSALIAMSKEPWRGLTNLASIGDADHFQNSDGNVAGSSLAYQGGNSVAPASAAIANSATPAAGLVNPDMPAQGATPAQERSGLLGLNFSDPVRMGLLSAGLGIMASPSHNLANAIGQGGLQGVAEYGNMVNQLREQGLTNAQIANLRSETANRPEQLDLERQKLGLQSAQFTRSINAARALAGLPPIPDALGSTGASSSSASAAPQPTNSAPVNNVSARPVPTSSTVSVAQPSQGTVSAGASPASSTPASTPLANPNDGFWNGVAPEDNPVVLRQRAVAAAAQGDSAGYSKNMTDAQTIMTRGTVMKNGVETPIPGFIETQVASEAAKAGATEGAKAASASTIAEQTQQGDALGKLPAKLDADAANARMQNTVLDQMKIESAGWQHGWSAQTQEQAREALKGVGDALGIDTSSLTQPIANYQDFVKNSGALIRDSLKEASSGSRGGVQLANLFAKSLPSPEMSEAGFNGVAVQFKGVNDFTVAREQASGIYAQAHNGSLKGFEQDWNKNVSPTAFIMHRMQVEDPQTFQQVVATMGAKGNAAGRAYLKDLKSQWDWANSHGLFGE